MRIVNMRVCAAAALLLAAAACGKQTALESGALMLSLSTASGAAAPDELRISVYDDTGALWKDARVPASGALIPESGSRLGTVLVQPGATSGNLRLHVRGLMAGARTLDGLLVVSPARAIARNVRCCRSILRCPPTTMPTAFRTPSTIAPVSRTPISADVRTTMVARAQAARAAAAAARAAAMRTPRPTVRRSTPAWTSAPTVAAIVPWAPRAASSSSARPGSASTASAARPQCTGPCRSCNQPSKDGMCLAYQQGTDPNRECTTGLTCNGVGSCGPPPTGSKQRGELCGAGPECMSGFCVDGVCCATACTDACRTCATGTCIDVKRKEDAPECVAPMTCNATARCVAQ